MEKTASMLMPVLAGAIGFGTVGHLENALTFSPLQLVIDNEIARYVRRCVKGIEVSDETLALDVIEQAGIGGHTVDTEHTSRHFRNELLLSPFFDVPSWGVGDAQDKERFEKMALDKARRLLAEETEPILSRSQQEAIDEIVAESKRDYGC